MTDSTNFINLTKQIKIVLEKHSAPDVVCQVALALDTSGSTLGMFRNGTMQSVMERIFAVAWSFDDNKQLEVWAFDTKSYSLPSATEDNYATYIKQEIIDNRSLNWGGTNYAPVASDIIQFYTDADSVDTITVQPNGEVTVAVKKLSLLGKIKKLFTRKPKAVIETSWNTALQKRAELDRLSTQEASGVPGLPGKPDDAVYCIFVTDGEASDSHTIETLLKKTSDRNVYWQTVGVGRSSFSTLKSLAGTLPNVGFTPVDDINSISDADLYNRLIDVKFINWYTKK